MVARSIDHAPLSDTLVNSSNVSLHSNSVRHTSRNHNDTDNRSDKPITGPRSPLLRPEYSPNLTPGDDSTLAPTITNSTIKDVALNSQINNTINDTDSIQPSEYSVSSITELTNMINPDRSLFYILVLTIILGGLQMAWTVEFSEGTPFLLSLGISKQALALVWIAGPLSGTIGQPVVGILSDNSDNRFGRRRPFIIGGCLVICLTLYMLSHSVEFIGMFVGSANIDFVKQKTIPFATIGIYVLDFSISAFQAASRALIVDMVPSHQQQLSNAWAARMIGSFNIFGYYLGSVDLTKFAPTWFGDNQFKSLTSSAIILLTLITLGGCYIIKERDPRSDILIRTERKKTAKRLKDLGLDESNTGVRNLVYSLYKQTLSSISRLSPQVKIVNATEFMAWIGYFPMLFYTTTYVGELYIYEVVQQRQAANMPPLNDTEKSKLLEDSTRRGSTALLVHSISSLVTNVVLPHFVKKKEKTTERHPIQRYYNGDDTLEDENYENNAIYATVRTMPNNKFKYWLVRISQYRISIQRSWTLSHLIFILCMISTFWITNSSQAIIMFAFLGIPWGNALWAPFVLIAEEITRIKEKKSIHAGNTILNRGVVGTSASAAPSPAANVKHQKYNQYEHESGIILGIHNVFVSAPQVVSSLFSSLLFMLLSSRFSKDDKFKGHFDDSLSWVFRFGGVMAIGAFVMSLKVKSNEELEKEDEEDNSVLA